MRERDLTFCKTDQKLAALARAPPPTGLRHLPRPTDIHRSGYMEPGWCVLDPSTWRAGRVVRAHPGSHKSRSRVRRPGPTATRQQSDPAQTLTTQESGQAYFEKARAPAIELATCGRSLDDVKVARMEEHLLNIAPGLMTGKVHHRAPVVVVRSA